MVGVNTLNSALVSTGNAAIMGH